MIRISIKIINLFITLKRMMFISYVDGSFNIWLEPQLFEFGKPASLHCNVTEKTKAVAWWIVGEDRSPKKISNELVLNFTSANHRHSAIYECFHTFENNGFLKYSRKVLVLETHCLKYVCASENSSRALIDWKFRFSTFPSDDVYFECNETMKSCYDRNGITLKDVNFVSPAFTTCSVGFEKSKIDLNKCPTNETVDERVCNLSCFLDVEITKETHRDATDLLQLTPSGNLDQRTSTIMIPIPQSFNINSLHPFLLVVAIVILTIVIIIIYFVMRVSLAKNCRKKHSKEIYDFREDDDDDETRGALTDECQTTTKTPKMASSKKILCFVKSCRGNIANWC